MFESRDVAPTLPAGAAVVRVSTAIGLCAVEARIACGLTAPELQTLRLSLNAPSMGALVSALRAPKSTVTSVVDQLAARKLVARATDARDRRRQIVAATEQGTTLIARFDAALSSSVEELVGALSAAQRGRLTELLELLPTPEKPTADS